MNEALVIGENEPLRILLTGSTGQVGCELLSSLEPFAMVSAPSRSELDLSDTSAVRAFVRKLQPHWIINPAAYTAVDKAETECDLAKTLNTVAPRVLGEEAARCNACLIHFSTDYVFDGSGETPWKETDAPNPLNTYGRTKLDGELALAKTEAASIVLRTSWVYGAKGQNFLRTILQLAKTRDELSIVADQFGAPTATRSLANAVRTIMLQTEAEVSVRGGHRTEVFQEKRGVYHATSAGETSWFGFAQEFLRLAAMADPTARFAELKPIATADYPTPARRPLNSRLNCDLLRNTFAIEFSDWRRSVAGVMK